MRSTILVFSALFAFGCAHEKPAAKTAADTSASTSTPTAKDTQVANTDTSDKGGDDACGAVRVHFALDSTDIADGDKPLLEKSAGCLKQDKKLHVTIEGNADERGTEEYNLSLGDKRARAVAQYLERLGVSGRQLKTVSYGKEQPECTEHDENCWSQNRRAAVKPASSPK